METGQSYTSSGFSTWSGHRGRTLWVPRGGGFGGSLLHRGFTSVEHQPLEVFESPTFGLVFPTTFTTLPGLAGPFPLIAVIWHHRDAPVVAGIMYHLMSVAIKSLCIQAIK